MKNQNVSKLIEMNQQVLLTDANRDKCLQWRTSFENMAVKDNTSWYQLVARLHEAVIITKRVSRDLGYLERGARDLHVWENELEKLWGKRNACLEVARLSEVVSFDDVWSLEEENRYQHVSCMDAYCSLWDDLERHDAMLLQEHASDTYFGDLDVSFTEHALYMLRCLLCIEFLHQTGTGVGEDGAKLVRHYVTCEPFGNQLSNRAFMDYVYLKYGEASACLEDMTIETEYVFGFILDVLSSFDLLQIMKAEHGVLS